jgi:hypothetical protein
MKETFLTILATASIGFLTLQKMQVWTEARVRQEHEEKAEKARKSNWALEELWAWGKQNPVTLDYRDWEEGGKSAEHFKKYGLTRPRYE